MKRNIIFAMTLLALLGGCRSEQEEFGGVLSSRRSSDIQILGVIAQPETRTTLDGLTVRWAEGDSIGVFSASAQNSAAVLDASSAGSTEGLFNVKLTAGNPQYAYYPYDETATGTRNSVSLSLPAVQLQTGTSPNMRYDVKAGHYLSGGMAEKYKFEFREKMALLRFDVTPGAELEGDVLESVSLTAAGRALAGDYTLNMADLDADLAFASGASATAAVSFASAPVLSATDPSTGWLFVNPDVKSGDPLVMEIRTDKHIVRVEVSASKDYLAGYRYTMPLNVPALVAAGKAIVSSLTPAADITGLTDCGVYDMEAKEYICKYEAGLCQYATYNFGPQHSYRLQSFRGGYAVEIAAPASLTEGAEVDVTVTVYGPIEVNDGTFKAKVVKVTSEKAWLSDVLNQAGYIVMR